MPNSSIALTDGVLQSLVNNGEARREFPFLERVYRTMQYVGNRRSCCGNSRTKRNNRASLGTIKTDIIALPPNRVNRLKQLLRVDEVVVYMDSKDGVKAIKL